MRRHGVGNNLRTAIADIEIGGATVLAGEHVSVISCLHGLDPREYDDPDRVDFTRRSASTPATFGYGPHRCPGNGLARMEMRIMIDEWLARIPSFDVDPDGTVAEASGGVNCVLQLPLRWPVA